MMKLFGILMLPLLQGANAFICHSHCDTLRQRRKVENYYPKRFSLLSVPSDENLSEKDDVIDGSPKRTNSASYFFHTSGFRRLSNEKEITEATQEISNSEIDKRHYLEQRVGTSPTFTSTIQENPDALKDEWERRRKAEESSRGKDAKARAKQQRKYWLERMSKGLGRRGNLGAWVEGLEAERVDNLTLDDNEAAPSQNSMAGALSSGDEDKGTRKEQLRPKIDEEIETTERDVDNSADKNKESEISEDTQVGVQDAKGEEEEVEDAHIDAAEEEEVRLKVDKEARSAAEQEAARLEEEEQARVAAEEEVVAKLKAEEEARIAAEEEEARLKAKEEAARIAAEEEAARLKAEEEARIAAEQEAARLKAEEEEAARMKAEEEARIAAEEESARLEKAEEEEATAAAKTTAEDGSTSNGETTVKIPESSDADAKETEEESLENEAEEEWKAQLFASRVGNALEVVEEVTSSSETAANGGSELMEQGEIALEDATEAKSEVDAMEATYKLIKEQNETVRLAAEDEALRLKLEAKQRAEEEARLQKEATERAKEEAILELKEKAEAEARLQARAKAMEEIDDEDEEEVKDRAVEEAKRLEEVEESSLDLTPLEDKATGSIFPSKLGPGRYILGVGVRKRAFKNIYSVGVYSDSIIKSSLSAISRSVDKSLALQTLQSKAKEVPTSFVLNIVSKTLSASAICKSIVADLSTRYSSSSDGGDSQEEDIATLKEFMVAGITECTKNSETIDGTRLQFDCCNDDGLLSVSVNDKTQGTIQSRRLCNAFCDMYLDGESACRTLRENCLENCCLP